MGVLSGLWEDLGSVCGWQKDNTMAQLGFCQPCNHPEIKMEYGVFKEGIRVGVLSNIMLYLLYKEYISVLSRIIVFLLQDGGCRYAAILE